MLDQNLTHVLVPSLNAHGNEHGLNFIPFPVYPHHGALDPEVVRIAERNNAMAILTGDKSDFAAKKLYFRLLLQAGISAAVIREYHLEVTSPELQLDGRTSMSNKRRKPALTRKGEPSQETEKGLEIPIPKADEFFGLLKKATKKPTREKPSRPDQERP